METDDNIQYEDPASDSPVDKALSEVDRNENNQSFYSIEPSLLDDLEFPLHITPNESRPSSSFALTSATQEPKTENLFHSDQPEREEEINSSLPKQTEESQPTNNISSTITDDQVSQEPKSLVSRDTSKPPSDDRSFTDIEGRFGPLLFLIYSYPFDHRSRFIYFSQTRNKI